MRIRLKIVIVISVIAFVVAGGYGISKRGTYTNVNDSEMPRANFSVAVFPDNSIDSISSPEEVEDNLMEKAESVIRVEALEISEFDFKISKQKVLVKEVLYGKEELEGTEITLIPKGGRIYGDIYKSVNMGFCNEMAVGKEYLVYITERINTIDESENAYFIPKLNVYAMFAYEPRESKPLGKKSAVMYSEVSEYEYFVQTEEGLEALLNLRKYVMEKWGQSETKQE